MFYGAHMIALWLVRAAAPLPEHSLVYTNLFAARLNPLGVLPAAFFFAALATGSGAMQRVAAVPSVAVQVIEALVIFFSVGFAMPKSRTS